MALYLDQNLLPKNHTQTTDFFLKKNFKNFNQVVEPSKIKDITDVELECLGYGIFDKETVLNNFIKYIIDVIQTCCEEKSPIKSFKIQLNGFELAPEKELLIRIGKQILAIKENLKVLWIHTSNIKRVTLKQFQYLLKLSVELTDINFEDFSLQCANWRFNKTQPTFKELQKIFTSLIDSASDLQTIKNKHFRLEISGWYYQKYDAQYLLGFKIQESQIEKLGLQKKYGNGNRFDEAIFSKQVQIFHAAMERFLKELLNCMDEIQEFELDIRNWNQDLRMKNLKKKLDNVTKQNRYEASIVSKRYDIQADEAQKQLKLIIVM